MSKARPARAVATPSPAATALRSYCQETGTSIFALSLAIEQSPKCVPDTPASAFATQNLLAILSRSRQQERL
jgi:hypothetical protein